MQFDFTLAAGQSQTVDIAGRFFKYKSGTGSIRVRASAGGYIDLLPGQGVWNVDFTSLTITDKSNAANAGVIVAGSFDFRDDRIVGQVEVISGERSRTLAGAAFVGYANASTTGLNLPHTQLWNPPGSGKNLIVGKMIISSGTAQYVRIGPYNTALASFAIAPQSKRLNGGTSVAEPRLTTVQTTMLVTNIMYVIQVPVGIAQVITLSEPILIPPGCGLAMCGLTVASDLPSHFEFYEENV